MEEEARDEGGESSGPLLERWTTTRRGRDDDEMDTEASRSTWVNPFDDPCFPPPPTTEECVPDVGTVANDGVPCRRMDGDEEYPIDVASGYEDDSDGDDSFAAPGLPFRAPARKRGEDGVGADPNRWECYYCKKKQDGEPKRCPHPDGPTYQDLPHAFCSEECVVSFGDYEVGNMGDDDMADRIRKQVEARAGRLINVFSYVDLLSSGLSKLSVDGTRTVPAGRNLTSEEALAESRAHLKGQDADRVQQEERRDTRKGARIK